MGTALLGLDAGELQAALGGGAAGYRGGQLYEALYRQRAPSWETITALPRRLREELSARLTLGWPEVAAEFASTDGTRRYLLRLDDSRTVETVFMPEETRDTICLSTQVGCAVGCTFCLTAQLGFERNLTAGEIVGEVLLVAARHNLSPQSRRLNVVMMGQGEPLLNLKNVLKATWLLTDPKGVGLSERRITVSTAGIVPRIAELGEASVRPKLAISLNASTSAQRRELMPITRKWDLRELLETCRRYPLRSWERLTFEYVLLKGVNDSDEDARRLVRLMRGLNAKVNLIALNPGPGIAFATPDTARVAGFQAIVAKTIPCFVRKPRGRDIYAACGQLKRAAETELVRIG